MALMTNGKAHPIVATTLTSPFTIGTKIYNAMVPEEDGFENPITDAIENVIEDVCC